MEDPTTELKSKLEQQQKEIQQLKEQAAQQQKEWETRLKEDSYENRLLKYQKLYKEAFGTMPTSLPTFSSPVPPTPDPPEEEDEQQSPYEEKLSSDVDKEKLKDLKDPTGPDIPAPMMNLLDMWFRTIHPGSEIQDTLKKCIRPKNAEALKVIQLNPEIKKWMSKLDDHKDQRMCWLCNATPRAAQPLVVAWAALSELEFAMQQAQDPESDVQDALIPIEKEGPKMNLSQVIRDIKLGLKCLGMVNVQANQKRCHDLQYKLAGAAKELAEFSKPLDDTLFGANVQKQLNTVIQCNKIANKVTSPAKQSRGRSNFLGRSCGRGRGSSSGYHNSHSHYQQQLPPHPPPGWHDQSQYSNQNPSPSYPPSNQQHQHGRSRGRGKQQPSSHLQRN